MTDSVDTLSGLTGMTRATLLSIWDQVRANQAKLDACARHDFKPVQPGNRSRSCLHCGGSLGLAEARWYELGRQHG